MSLAEQLANDINLLKKKYMTKKAMANKMADYLGSSIDSFYPYFTRNTTGKEVGKRFYRNFYKVFRAELYAIKGKVNIPEPDAQTFDYMVNTFDKLAQCVEKLTLNMEKIVSVQAMILDRLDGKSSTKVPNFKSY